MSTSETDDAPIVQKDWMERASDFVNPLLVKETRQSLKSRGFVSVFLLMLIASWLISAGGTLYAYGPELAYSAAGRHFFWMYYAVLAFAVFLVIPQGAFRSIQSERDLQTFEMLIITTLSPRRIVWGKWWSAVVQTSVYYAAIAPFMMFTNLLRGISLITIVLFLSWSFIISICLSMLAITFSTFTKQRQAFGLIQFLLLGPLAGVLMAVVGWSWVVLSIELPIDRYEFWIAHVVVFSVLIPVFILLRQIATANLTFEGANRSTGIRISCFSIMAILISWISILCFYPRFFSTVIPAGSAASIPTEVLYIWFSMLMAFASIVGLFATTEDERLSRRVREEVPDSPLYRMFVLPVFPGGGRGFVYLFLILGGLELAFWVMIPKTSAGYLSSIPDQHGRAKVVNIVMASYVLFYLGITAFLGRSLRRLGTDLHAAHARVLGVLLLAIGSLAPFFFLFIDEQILTRHPWLLLSNPFVNCYYFFYSPQYAPVWELGSLSIPLPLFLGVLGVGLNLVSISNAIREFFSLPLRAPFVVELE